MTQPALRTVEPAEASTPALPEPERWSFGRRVLLRFGISYLALFALPFPADWSWLPMSFWEAYGKAWLPLVQATHRFVLRRTGEITVLPAGSGDTTFNYVQLVTFVLLAAASTALWSVIDRRPTRPARLVGWARIYARYYLAVTMCTYGFMKVFYLQFSPPNEARLMQTFGESSPMGLLWTFMGYSASYTIFTGAAELLAGLLLFFRRTTLLGALVTCAVMANVVMLNFSYDVPAKIFSSHLLAIAVVLAAPDVRRLARFFVLQQPVFPRVEQRPYSASGALRAGYAVKALYIGAVLIGGVWSNVRDMKQYGAWAPERPFVGAYVPVEPSARADDWVRVAFTRAWEDNKSTVRVRKFDGSLHDYGFERDDVAKSFKVVSAESQYMFSTVEAKPLGHLTFERAPSGELTLRGELEGKPFETRLRRATGQHFLLQRGFHWINEYPEGR